MSRLDFVIKNARLPQAEAAGLHASRSLVDVAIRDGKIVEIAPSIQGEFSEGFDAAGHLVTPPFVDAHFHLDSALVLNASLRNISGTLLEGIELWGRIKPTLTFDAVVERAMKYCDLAVARGLLAVRSHVDVCDPRLLAVEALLEVKRRVKPYLDLQLVAFPQDGYLRSPGAAEQLTRALELGVEVVGGIPHHERTMEEGAASVRALCRLAAERGLRVDMHCDETDDPLSRHVETLVAETIRHGLQGRVTGSHLTSLHSVDNYYASKIIRLMHEARLQVVANPLINITLQGRFDTYPKRRGMTRVKELLEAGVNVAFGHDCVRDPWYPLGSADMLEVAQMGLHVGQLTSEVEMRRCFEAVTYNPARILGLTDYGIQVGHPADLVVLQAADEIDAIRLRPPRLLVMKAGQIISRMPRQEARLSLPGRPAIQHFSDSTEG